MENDNQNRYDLAFGFLQVFDVLLNVSQVSNDVLLKKLELQDKVLNEQSKELQKQTNEYLERIIRQNCKIIKQNEEIKSLLKKYGTLDERSYSDCKLER